MADATALGQGSPPPARRRYPPPPPKTEPVWPAVAAVLAAIALQLTLPEPLRIVSKGLMPLAEAAVVVVLVVVQGEHRWRRHAVLYTIAGVMIANAVSLGAITHFLIHKSNVGAPRDLLVGGVLIWSTNFILGTIWYWALDRGGPLRRARGEDGRPDLLFPQMTDDTIEPLDWRPNFVDYTYVSLTNSTAFSPTDTMPLTAPAKLMMGAQSLVSLVTIGLIISRAVNILQT